MDRLDHGKKRSMMLFALFLISTIVILSALSFGSAIHKLISAL